MKREDVRIQKTVWDSKKKEWVPVHDYVEDLDGNKWYKE